ncbi:hypothetical protein BC827DRAFT_489860 [Russula dissimulans]|nr:hypothetical protein BC827DRAFT_489860 [Russula dissimulans]
MSPQYSAGNQLLPHVVMWYLSASASSDYLSSTVTKLRCDLDRHVKLPIPQPDLWCLSLESCTVPPQVLESKIVMKSAFAIAFAFATSLALVNAGAIHKLEERQTVCTDGGCSVTCKELSTSDIYTSDCQTVVNLLDGYAPGSLTLKAQTEAYWTSGTCTITIANVDDIDYTVCYSTLAYDAAATVNSCIGVTAGAICAASQGPGQKWAIEIS